MPEGLLAGYPPKARFARIVEDKGLAINRPLLRSGLLGQILHPWRCLCLGLALHIIKMRLLRRTIVHDLQIFFTDERTFMPLLLTRASMSRANAKLE